MDEATIQEVQVTEKGKENPTLNEIIKRKRGRPLGWRGTYKKKVKEVNNEN